MEMEKLIQLLGTGLILAILVYFLIPQRAWGETSLLNLFTGENQNNNDGSLELGHKALHVKLDVEDSTNPNVYEFHMTDQGIFGNKHLIYEESLIGKTYFTIRNWNKDKCTLFTTRKIPDILSLDIYENFNYVYYIDAGAIIESSCGSLNGCIKGSLFSSGCEKICTDFKEDKQPSDFSICGPSCWGEGLAKENKVLTQLFSKGMEYCNEYKDGCPSEANGGCCPLVGEEPSKKYMPQYGLICGYEQVSEKSIDSNAKWFACTDDLGSRGRKVYTASAGGAQYSCNSRNWVPTTDQGTDLENVQIKYDSSWGDEYTALKFYLANHNKNSITDVSIKTKITNTGINCDGATSATVGDCTELNIDKSKDIGWKEIEKGKMFNSEGLTCPIDFGVDDDDFCLNAKTFDVEVKYKYSGSDKTDKFKITCSPKTIIVNGIWDDKVCIVSKV